MESFTIIFLLPDSRAGDGAPQKIDHAVIGGVVAVVMFAILCALIVLGRYFARHKGETRTPKSYFITLGSERVEFNQIEAHKWPRRLKFSALFA